MKLKNKPPNVLFIMTDQHNFQLLGCAGHSVIKTPNIDQLAKNGVLFENAYCPAPVCGPSRAAVFTGLHSQSNGVIANWMPMKERVRLLPEILQNNGYHTALVGKLHIAPCTASHGFDYKKLHDAMHDVYCPDEPWHSDYVKWLAQKKFNGDLNEVIKRANEDETACEAGDWTRFTLGSNWREEREHSNTWVTEKSLEYLGEKSSEPFFLFTSYFGPHQPMRAPEPWASMYDPKEIDLPEEFYVSLDNKPKGGIHLTQVPPTSCGLRQQSAGMAMKQS